MKKRNLIIYIIFTLVVLFTMLPEAKAYKWNTCDYSYNDCRFGFRQTMSGSNWEIIPTGYGSVNCNKEDKVKGIAFNDHTTMVNFYKNFKRVQSNLGDACPEIRVNKNPSSDCSLSPSSSSNAGRTEPTSRCYPLGARAFEPGKCTPTKNYDCVKNGVYDTGLTEDETDEDNGSVASIDKLTSIGISDGYVPCEKLLGDSVIEVLDIIFLIIRIITPILLIVLTMLDFASAIAGGEDALKKATDKFIKRLIAAVLIFLTPTLINFLMDITGISDGSCGLDL